MNRAQILRVLMHAFVLCSGLVGRVFAGDDQLQVDSASVMQQTTPPSNADFRTALETIRRTHQLPALGFYFSAPGQPEETITAGFRRDGDPTPVSNTDAFHLGSCGKAFTATLVGKFVDAGRLHWQTKIADVYGDNIAINPGFDAVTVELLLSHRAGLTGDIMGYDEGTLWKQLRSPELSARAGRALVAQTLLRNGPAQAPAEKFVYSNAGYIILGNMLEHVSNQSWETLIRKEIFQPLQMQSCSFGNPIAADATIIDSPRPHEFRDGHNVPLESIPAADNPPAFGPAGTIRCSLADWAKFVTMQLRGFRGERDFLTASTFNKLQQIAPGNSVGYTYGAWIRRDIPWAQGPLFSHAGSNTFNSAKVWWAPQTQSIALTVTNTAHERAWPALNQVLLLTIPRMQGDGSHPTAPNH